MPLTDVQIRKAKPADKPYKLADQQSLYLEVRPSGVKLWRYGYSIAGKRNTFAIGAYPEFSLADARAKHGEARALVRQGIHPAHERARQVARQVGENADTFQALAEEWQQAHQGTWSTYYANQVRTAMAKDVYPRIGRRPIRSVTSAEVLVILDAVAGRGAKTVAINIRQWISAVYGYAAARLKADADPAALLRRTVKRNEIEHAENIGEEGLRRFLAALATYGGNRATCIAIEMMVMLWPRTAEMRKARWPDIDLDDALWRPPVGTMKKRRRHLVPLPRQMVELLRELQGITGAGEHLFPSTRRPRTPISATTVNRALEYMGLPMSGHDFRATAATMLREMGWEGAWVEVQLAHAPRSRTQAAYDHAQYLQQRRDMMQAWADYLDTLRPQPNPGIQ